MDLTIVGGSLRVGRGPDSRARVCLMVHARDYGQVKSRAHICYNKRTGSGSPRTQTTIMMHREGIHDFYGKRL